MAIVGLLRESATEQSYQQGRWDMGNDMEEGPNFSKWQYVLGQSYKGEAHIKRL